MSTGPPLWGGGLVSSRGREMGCSIFAHRYLRYLYWFVFHSLLRWFSSGGFYKKLLFSIKEIPISALLHWTFRRFLRPIFIDILVIRRIPFYSFSYYSQRDLNPSHLFGRQGVYQITYMSFIQLLFPEQLLCYDLP